MRKLVALIFIGLNSLTFAQDEFEVWTELGAGGEIVNDLDWQVDLNTRFGNQGINTFFPQVGLEYKVDKLFRPSIEYRYILDQDEYGNFIGANRLNFNISMKDNVKRFTLSARFRYQYGFNALRSGDDFNPDFDRAFRGKFGAEYDINNSIFTPEASIEFFYNPLYGPSTPSFSKMRISIGTELELDGPHKVSFKYQLDDRFEFLAPSRHVISVSYGYKF